MTNPDGMIGSFRESIFSPIPDEYIYRCPACADVYSYCLGHGELGDPVGHAVMRLHDNGDHRECRKEADCEGP